MVLGTLLKLVGQQFTYAFFKTNDVIMKTIFPLKGMIKVSLEKKCFSMLIVLAKIMHPIPPFGYYFQCPPYDEKKPQLFELFKIEIPTSLRG